MQIEEIVIGKSDYTKEQMEQDNCGWTLGTSASDFLHSIKEYEAEGYTVKFETSLFRQIFGMGKYKVTATKINE